MELGVIMLPVEMGPCSVVKKAISEDPHGRMKFSGKVYFRSEIQGLPPGSQCLISIHPTMREVQSCLHQAQKKGQCP